MNGKRIQLGDTFGDHPGDPDLAPSFEAWDFRFVSCFELRASDLAPNTLDSCHNSKGFSEVGSNAQGLPLQGASVPLCGLDLFTVGIGPSSSHTVGPMRAARRFAEALDRRRLMEPTTRVQVELFGSRGGLAINVIEC